MSRHCPHPSRGPSLIPNSIPLSSHWTRCVTPSEPYPYMCVLLWFWRGNSFILLRLLQHFCAKMKSFFLAVPIIVKSNFEAEISQISTEDKMAPKNLSEVLLTVTQYWLNILTQFVCFTLEITRELYMVLSIANSAIITAIDKCFNTSDTNNAEMLGPFVLSQFGHSREVHSSNLKCHSYPPAQEVITPTSHQCALGLSPGVSACDGLW